MKAEIICVGTELLLGHIINTNASFIAGNLARIGIDHYFQATVGDNHKRLSDAISAAISRSDIVITTGGLGPTVDDITAQVISNVTGKQLVLEKSILLDMSGFFKRLNRKMPKDNIRQALIPEGAKWLKNPNGTAPGLIVEYKACLIIALPGPPREMQPMMTDQVIPYLKDRVKAQGFRGMIIKSRSVRLFGIAETSINEKVKDLLSLSGPATVGIYAKQGEVELKIMTKAKDDRAADINIKKIERIINKRFGALVYGFDDQTLEQTVVSLLIKKRKTIAVAESCTGGLLAGMVTNISGASGIFNEGIVTYSNESKIKYLGVKEQTLKKYGAVSCQVAKEMACGIRNSAGADIGIGITGIAGPTGGTRTKPVGLVFIALASKNRVIYKQYNFQGSRIEIKNQAARAALNLIRNNL